MEMLKKIMKTAGIILAVLVGIIVIFAIVIFTIRAVNGSKYKIKSSGGIDESTYIQINGIQQYINIRGEDTSNPVMIFVHGGPASPMGYVAPYYQQPIEEKFTVINYDQRGCGRTYYANGKSFENLTVEQLERDLDAIVDYACERFGQDKVVIMGHSWGTILGTVYAKNHPGKVSAYIGVSQCISNLFDGKIVIGEKALAVASSKNKKDAEELEAALSRMRDVSDYDEMSVDDLMTAASLSSKYLACEGEMSSMGQMWTGLTSPQMNMQDVGWFMHMTNTSEFFASQRALMEYAFFGFDLNEMGSEYEFPVYYIAGSDDYAVPQELAKKYYDTVTAPDKEFVTVENTGHSMFMDNPEEFSRVVLSFFE